MVGEQVKLHQRRRIRVIDEANFIISTKCTTREAALKFNMSKSCIYRDMTEVLPMVSENLASEVSSILQYNKAVRHLRGGEVTRNRYCKKLQNRKGWAYEHRKQ